jgi:4-amino-4-deoxy-L-arabinose transferase-like glycosyltransferase
MQRGEKFGVSTAPIDASPGCVQRAIVSLERATASPLRFVAIVILTRVAFSFAVFPALTAGSEMLNSVPDDYDKIAHNLAQGHGYVLAPGTPGTMQRLPLYPLLLAGFFAVLGDSVWPILLAQAAIDALSGLLVRGLADRLFGDRVVSSLAGLLFALYPGFLVASARLVTEPVYTFLLLGAVTLYLVGRSGRVVSATALAGLVLGCAALCKSAGLLLPFCLGSLARSNLDRSRAMAIARTTAILLGAVLVVLSPWIVRNFLLIGRVFPASTIGGTVVYDALYITEAQPTDREFFRLVDLSKQAQHRLLSSHGISTHSARYPFWFHRAEDEYRWDRLMYGAVVTAVTETPWKGVRMLLTNAVGFWVVGRTWRATLLATALHIPLLLLAAFGLRRVRAERREEAWVLVAVIVYFNAVYAASLGMVRYSVPVMPLILVFASNGLRELCAVSGHLYGTARASRGHRDRRDVPLGA